MKGFSLPRTPKGTSSIVPAPPWHFVGDVMAVSFEADENNIAGFLPKGLTFESNKCCVYFIEWQATSQENLEYLDPVRSQYKETIVLLSAKYNDTKVSYCPFIWVDQDISLVRGMFQGWPKQIGSTWITRSYNLASPAGPKLISGGKFGATLSAKDRRLIDADISLNKEVKNLPYPGFEKAINLRYFPNLEIEKYNEPLVNELVQLKSRDISFSTIWEGDAKMKFYDNPYLELPALKPLKINKGYRFSFALTVDDIIKLKSLS